MIGVCLGLAGVVWSQWAVADFTLAWTHTIEKIRWEEDYHVTRQGLVLGEARVRGNGAGMEIPDDATLAHGSWHYRRQLPPLQPLNLGRTPQAGDYQLCSKGECHAMAEWIGPPTAEKPSVQMWACDIPQEKAPE